MLKIDCLVINTQLEKDMRDIVEILAYERAGNKRDASLGAVYADMRKAGIEVDLRTVGHIYASILPLADKNFSSIEEIEDLVGAKFEKTVRNLVLMEDKEGEQQIGDQSPAQAVAGAMANAFNNANVTDNRTQSIMRTMQEAMKKGAQRMLGDLPGKAIVQKDFTSIVQGALDLEQMGYRDLNGAVNGIKKLFDATRQEVAAYTDRINAEADPLIQDQWREYVDNFENAAYSLLFSKNEAKKIVYDAMVEAGFGRATSNNNQVLDWKKLAGSINDVSQIRKNVENALKEKGFSQDARDAVKNSLENEFHELRGQILQRASATATTRQNTGKSLDTIVGNAMAFMKRGYTFGMSASEANTVVREGLKEAGYTLEDKNGKISMDWTRLAGELKDKAAVQQAMEKVLADKGYSPAEISAMAPFVDNVYQQMVDEIKVRADNELAAREKRIGAEKSDSKSDWTRLAELHALGVFNRQHDAVLHRMLGVSELRDRDIAQIEEISRRASDLSREMEGKDYLAGYVFQNLQRDINDVISRNISNKTNRLKVVSAINKYFQALNFGRIANAFNMLENNLSGTREMLATNFRVLQQMGTGSAFKDFKLALAVFKDATSGGVSYGEEFGRFSNQERIDDQFRDINFSNPKEIGRSLLTLAFRPGRAFLNGSDSAFKSIMHKKMMMLALHRALTQNGMDKQDANHFLHEALYGQSFDDAKVRASAMLDKYGIKNTKAAVFRLANDLIVGNLNTDGNLTDDVIEAAHDSSYRVAGVGMGHEAQGSNIFAQKIQAGKIAAAQRDAQLIKDEQWGQLASSRTYNTIYYGAIQPFLGGILNWAQLRIQSGFGLGIVTGLMGNYKGDIDFASKDDLKKSIFDVENKRQQIARGVTGLAVTGLAFGLKLLIQGLRGGADDDDDMGGYGGIKGDYFLNKAFLRSAPDLMVMSYLANTEKDGSVASWKYISQYYNLGTDFDIDVQVYRIKQDLERGNTASARGRIGALIGSRAESPLWRSYKGTYQLINWAAGDEAKPTYKTAYTFFEGLLGGNMLEDIGIFQRDSPIEALPGIGSKTAEKMRKAGIDKISDLKSHPGWKSYIHTTKGRKKAFNAYKEVYKEGQ